MNIDLSSQKIYIVLAFLILVIILAYTGKNRQQAIPLPITNVPAIVPGKINAPNAISPGHQVIAGPLISPDGGIIYILENGEVREIM